MKRKTICGLFMASLLVFQTGCASTTAQATEEPPVASQGLQNSDWDADPWPEKTDAPYGVLPCSLTQEEQELVQAICMETGADHPFILALLDQDTTLRPLTADMVQDVCHQMNVLDSKYKAQGMDLMAFELGEEEAQKLWEQGIYSTEYSNKVLEKKSEFFS